MNAQLLLAEAATPHPDGTVSLLRGGITHIWGKAAPFAFRGSLVIRIEGEMGDAGAHQLELRCMDEDGRTVGPDVRGSFAVPTGGGTTHTILGVDVSFPRKGRFTFSLRIDNVVVATLTVTTAEAPVPAKP